VNPQAESSPLSFTNDILTVSAVLENHASALGHDFIAYRNHVYRVVNLCLAIAGEGDRVELEKIAVAAVSHDLGIWTNHTFDYIAPSVALAREHLSACAQTDWIPEIEAMIGDHHEITASRPNRPPLVEPFRRADWIDVSRGLRTFGETRKYIRDFGRLAMQTTTARELYDEMLKLYPDWINRRALFTSVQAVKT
jgi:hypothetical protein